MDTRSNQPTSLYSLVFQKCLKVYTVTQCLPSYKWLIRSIQCKYSAYPYKKFMPWTISALFSTRNRVISILNLTSIESQTQNPQKQFRIIILKILFLQNILGTTISQSFSEKQKIYDRYRYIHIDRYINTQKEIYYEKLAHIIMKVQEAHDMLSASWRLSKTSGIIPNQT